MMSRQIYATFFVLLLIQAAIRHAEAKDKTPPVADKAYAIYAPKPDYPYEARDRRQTGFGIVVVRVDRATGAVIEAVMARSTGVRILDAATLNAFRRWKFKPGTVSMAKIPVTFTMSGSVYTELEVKKSRPMDQVLAPFLGKGNVINGPIPKYPTFPAWTYKQGKGVYELHVGGDGKVADVRILKRSGDERFDRVAVSTLRKWRLRTGPRVIELPLAFKLTPDSYDVGIP
jgi:TonB family protein